MKNNWKLVDTDNISGRLNVMWLSSDGIGILTREYSHMTILNMILENHLIMFRCSLRYGAQVRNMD